MTERITRARVVDIKERQPTTRDAWIFSGQGGQYKGMGQALALSNPTVAAFYETARKISGLDYLKLSDNDTALGRTEFVQPMIYLNNHSCFTAVGQVTETEAVVSAGHSLGQFNSLVVAGALSFEEGLKLVIARGKAMQEACDRTPSTKFLLLTRTPNEQYETVARNLVEEFNLYPGVYNAPGQMAFGGTLADVAKAQDYATQEGIKVLPMQVNGAFHSPLMQSAVEPMEEALSRADIQQARIPIIANTTAMEISTPEEITEESRRHLTKPVLWMQTMERMQDLGVDQYNEFGEKSILLKFIDQPGGLVSMRLASRFTTEAALNRPFPNFPYCWN